MEYYHRLRSFPARCEEGVEGGGPRGQEPVEPLAIRVQGSDFNNYFEERWSGYEEGLHLRLMDLCITQI